MRYSLRTLLIVVTLVCIGCGWWARNAALERQFNEAMDYLSAQGIRVHFEEVRFRSRFLPIRELQLDLRKARWDEQTPDCLSLLRSVDLLSLGLMELTDEQRNVLLSLPGLKAIEIYSGRLSAEDVEAIVSRAPELRSLSTYGPEVDLDSLPQIMRIRQLTNLHLVDVFDRESLPDVIEYPTNSTVRFLEIGDYTSVRIQEMPCVEEINVLCGNWRNDKWGSLALATCPKLKTLRIKISGKRPRSDSLLEIADQPALVEFSLVDGGLSPVGVHKLSKMPSLRSLLLVSPIMSDETVLAFEHLDQIERLRIEWPMVYGPAMSQAEMEKASAEQPDEGDEIEAETDLEPAEGTRWAILKKCARLRSLDLSVSLNSPEELQWLCEMKGLKTLDLSPMVAGWKDSLTFALSDIHELEKLAFLEELIVEEVDMSEEQIRSILPKTKVRTPTNDD